MTISPYKGCALVATALMAVAAVRAPAIAPHSRAMNKQAATKPAMAPDVAELIRKSTEAYKAMKSYQHTARYNLGITGDRTITLQFTLAVERPNRFAYRLMTDDLEPAADAVCDGKTFINLKGNTEDRLEYTKIKAPETIRGINIVDDVEFAPIGTYIVALMLQGDATADKQIKAALGKATLRPMAVTEDGKKWQVIDMPLDASGNLYAMYFGADDHLIGKAVLKGSTPVTEVIESVRINKPVAPEVFQYTPPAKAKQVERFTAPQRPDDA